MVSWDVIFDELGSWYSPKQNVKIDEDCENEDSDKSENARDNHRDGSHAGQQSPTSMECSGPSGSSGSKSESNAWSGKHARHKKYDDKKGKQKMPEYEICIVVILIYVDDLIIGGDSMEEISKLKKNLEMKFQMKDLGEVRYFLGIEMIRSESGICMLQKK